MIRRIICVLLVLILCIMEVSIALAAEKMIMIPIPERGISIAVPESHITFNRNDQVVDPRLESLGLSANEWQTAMQPDIYLYIFHPSFQYDINVTVTDSNNFTSLSFFTDDMLQTFVDIIKSQFENVGGKVQKCDIKRDQNITYIRTWIENTQYNDRYALQYLTVVDSQTIVFTLTSYNGQITAEEENLLEQVFTSSVLNKDGEVSIVERPIEDDTPNLNYYHDSETGINFMIPNGWEQRELSQERKIIKMKMSPVDDTSASIMFGWEDIWAKIPEASRKAWGLSTRQDLDSWATSDILASMYGVDEKDIEIKQYAGLNFGIGWIKQEAYGISVSMLCAVTIKNGYAISFQFMDLNKAYDDFLYKVLDSVYLD